MDRFYQYYMNMDCGSSLVDNDTLRESRDTNVESSQSSENKNDWRNFFTSGSDGGYMV